MVWWGVEPTTRRWRVSKVVGSTPGHSDNNPRHQAVQTGTGQSALTSYGWEGNRRSGVALTVCQRLSSRCSDNIAISDGADAKLLDGSGPAEIRTRDL